MAKVQVDRTEQHQRQLETGRPHPGEEARRRLTELPETERRLPEFDITREAKMTRLSGNQWKPVLAVLLATILMGAGEAFADAEDLSVDPQDQQSEKVTESHGSGPPFAVSLLLRRTSGGNQRSCTGVVLSRHWVMTAGHCVRGAPVHDNNKDRVEVLAGPSASTTVFNGGGSYYMHPEYSGSDSDMGDDFALILLYDAGLSSFTPAKIMGESSAGYLASEIGRGIGHAWIAGYGRGTGAGGSKACSKGTGGKSRTGNFKIVPNWPNGPGKVPTRWSPGSPFINEIRLKFGHHRPCKGDSGAPIYFQYDGQDVVAGLWSGTVDIPVIQQLHKGPSIRRRLDWIIAKSKEKGVPLDCKPGNSNVGPDWWSCTE